MQIFDCRKKISTHQYYILITIAEIIFNIFALVSLKMSNETIWFVYFFILTTIQLIFHIIIIYKLYKEILNFSIIFLLCSYFFNYGHLFLKAFNIEFGPNVLFPLWYVDFSIYKQSAIFTFLVQSFVFVGIILIYLFCKKRKKPLLRSNKFNFNNVDLNSIKIIGFVFFAIGIIPTLYVDISKLLLFYQGGYLNALHMHIHDFVQVIANCINFSVFALIIAYHNDKRKANIIFFLTVFYKVIMMSSGGRGQTIVFLLCLFLVWGSIVQKISFKNLILLIVIGYFALSLLNFIASVRNIATFNIDNIVSIFIKSITSNQITLALSEFGSTFSTICFTIESKPNISFGLNYILPILLVLPNIKGFNTPIVDLMIFTKHIYTYEQPIGGSYVAELYYSFSWFGIIFAIFVGLFIGFITYKIYVSKRNNNYFSLLLYSCLTPSVLWWIRGYFGAIYREYIWHISLAIIILIIINKLRSKKVIKWK